MLTALLLAVASAGAPPVTPSPSPVPTPPAKPVLSRQAPAGGQPADLSSYAGKVKVDKSKADSLFKQDGPAPAPEPEAQGTTLRPASRIGSRSGEGDAPASSGSEEASWRSRAENLRRNLERARADKAATERNLPPAATSSEGTAQRSTLLYRYQVRIDQAQAALDALAVECRQAPGCQPGWVR